MLNAYQNGFPRLAVADNLSETGIRLRRVLEPSELGHHHIDVEFQLPNDPEVFFLRGELVYSSQLHGYVGVRFLNLSDGQRGKIRSFVAPTKLHLN